MNMLLSLRQHLRVNYFANFVTARRDFTIRLKRLKPKAPDCGGPKFQD